MLKSINLSPTSIVDYSLIVANVSPEVGVVRYELVCLLVKSGCEDVQLEYGFDGFIITHFTTNTSSTMQPRRIPATFSPCLLLHGTMDSVLVSGMLK